MIELGRNLWDVYGPIFFVIDFHNLPMENYAINFDYSRTALLILHYSLGYANFLKLYVLNGILMYPKKYTNGFIPGYNCIHKIFMAINTEYK